MPSKATWLFNGRSGVDVDSSVFGWSESWYTGRAGADLEAAMDAISLVRAAILASGSFIVGYRISTGPGQAYVIRKSFKPPFANDGCNLPVDSALCQVNIVGSNNLKRFWLHNLPDSWINQATIAPDRIPFVRLTVKAYCDAGFGVRIQNQANAQIGVLSIDNTGLVTTIAAHGLAVGNECSFLRCSDINGRTIRGQWIVTTVPSATTFTVAHWPNLTVARSGKVRLTSFLYNNAVYPGDRSVIRGGSRKVGRPFFQSRGRAAART